MNSLLCLRISRFALLVAVFALCLGGCASSPRQVWIGVRSDGKVGSGKPDDPFDGSSQQRFDGLLRKYWASGVENLEVNLLPGTYETVGNGDYIPGFRIGNEGWRCNSGWTIRGAGQGITVLRLTKIYPHPSENTYSATGISTTDSNVIGVTVEDLTVDCNHSAIGNAKSTEGGVGLAGSNHTIRRVTVENVAGLGHEGFPIYIGSNSVNSSNNLIEDCVIRGWRGGTGGSITIANNLNNGQPPATWTSGIIRRNRVEGTHIGYGGWGMNEVLFTDNTAVGCDYGVNVDSLGNESVHFVNNTFQDCGSYGMVFAQCRLFQITGNTISLAGGGPYFYFLNNVADFVIANNKLNAANGTPSMAALRDADTVTGEFAFKNNTANPPASIDLPSQLLGTSL